MINFSSHNIQTTHRSGYMPTVVNNNNAGSSIKDTKEIPSKVYSYATTLKSPGLKYFVSNVAYSSQFEPDKKDENGKLLPDKERLTKFGKVLRATSLDELPELVNILKGDMSLIGPRPLAVCYLPYYNEIEKHRHDVRPGLTGLAQINGRNALNWEDRFNLDIEYVNNITFFNDIKILFKTIYKVIKKDDVVVSGTGSVTDFDVYRKKQIEERKNK